MSGLAYVQNTPEYETYVKKAPHFLPGIFSLKHESSIFRSIIQPCLCGFGIARPVLHRPNSTGSNPGTKKDAGTAIWPSKLSPGSPWGFRKVLYYVKQLAASLAESWRLGFPMTNHGLSKDSKVAMSDYQWQTTVSQEQRNCMLQLLLTNRGYSKGIGACNFPLILWNFFFWLTAVCHQ